MESSVYVAQFGGAASVGFCRPYRKPVAVDRTRDITSIDPTLEVVSLPNSAPPCRSSTTVRASARPPNPHARVVMLPLTRPLRPRVPVSESVSFPESEEGILAEWEKNDTFRESVRLSEGRPRWSFYDGPPFATGLPHYGHLLAGTIKVDERERALAHLCHPPAAASRTATPSLSSDPAPPLLRAHGCPRTPLARHTSLPREWQSAAALPVGCR